MTATASSSGNRCTRLPPIPVMYDGAVPAERAEPPQVAVLRLSVDASLRGHRVIEPGGRNEPALQVRAAEVVQRAARQLQSARSGGLAARRLRPMPAVDAERREQLALREVRQRLAERTLERDTETDDARGAVAEAPRLAHGKAEREADPVVGRVHPLLVAGRCIVPVVALEAGAHGQQVAQRDRVLRCGRRSRDRAAASAARRRRARGRARSRSRAATRRSSSCRTGCCAASRARRRGVARRRSRHCARRRRS